MNRYEPHRGETLQLAVVRCFPDGARIIVILRRPDVVFAVSWQLGGDPSRPQKRSKIIRLTIDATVVENYAQASAVLRADADARIAARCASIWHSSNPSMRGTPLGILRSSSGELAVRVNPGAAQICSGSYVRLRPSPARRFTGAQATICSRLHEVSSCLRSCLKA